MFFKPERNNGIEKLHRLHILFCGLMKNTGLNVGQIKLMYCANYRPVSKNRLCKKTPALTANGTWSRWLFSAPTVLYLNNRGKKTSRDLNLPFAFWFYLYTQ